MNNDFGFDNYTYHDMKPVNDFMFQEAVRPASPTQTMLNSMMQMPANPNRELATPYDGFTRGNMFNRLYNQYKNYRPMKLVPNSEQAEFLLNVDQLTFVAHELNLYLDVYPEDQEMIRMFNQYTLMAKEAIERYETKYGPMNALAPSDPNRFSWEMSTWPWEMEES